MLDYAESVFRRKTYLLGAPAETLRLNQIGLNPIDVLSRSRFGTGLNGGKDPQIVCSGPVEWTPPSKRKQGDVP